MWKLILGFVIFAALVMFMLLKGGDIDMGGERHDAPMTAPPPAASEPAKK